MVPAAWRRQLARREINRRTNYISTANFSSGRVSASIVIHEKIGDQGANGLRCRLVARDSLGGELTWGATEDNDVPGTPLFYTRLVPQGNITSAQTLIIADNVELPAGTVEIALDIRIETTVQMFFTKVCLREGADPSYKSNYVEDSRAFAYVSPTGSDATGTGDNYAPFATIDAALSALGGAGTVFLIGAEFGQEQKISPELVSGRVLIAGQFSGGNLTVIRLSEKFSGVSKTTGRAKVYQVGGVSLPRTPSWIYQDGVPDSRTEIPASELRPEHNGRSHRLYCTKIVAAEAVTLPDALDEMDIAADPRCFYDSGSSTLYFTVDGGGDGTVADVYMDSSTGLIKLGVLESAGEIVLQNLDVRYGGVNTRPFRRTHLSNVKILGARGNCWDHAGSSSFEYLEASCGGSANNDLGDGINGHNHANLVGIGAYSHDNKDDGESNHEWGRVRMGASLFEHNGGTAVAPAYGCDAIYTDVVSVKNQRIHGRKPGAFAVIGNPIDGGNETLAIFRRCWSEGDTVSFFDNSQGSSARAICEECVSIDPSNTAYDVSTIRDSRHSGTGTAKTAKVLVSNSTVVA